MSTLIGPMRSLPQGTVDRIAIATGMILALIIPVFAVNLALIAAAVSAIRRSTNWRWYLVIAALAFVVLMIDPTPFGIGQFRPSEGKPD